MHLPTKVNEGFYINAFTACPELSNISRYIVGANFHF